MSVSHSFVMDGTIEIEECEEPTCENLNSDEQFLRSQDANFETTEGNVPVTEMLEVISESTAAMRNLQSLMQASPCTNHQNSTNTSNSVESKTKPEAEINSAQEEVGSSSASGATTTEIIYYDSNFQRYSFSLEHRDSAELNVNVEKCHNVVTGDKAEVNFCCNNGLLNQKETPEATYVRSNEKYHVLQADGGASNVVNLSRRKKHGKRPSQRNSGKKSTSKEKIKTEWYFPMFLSDFTDSESLEKDIDQWLKGLVSSLLREAQDCLEDFDSVIKLLEEAGERVRESSIPNCIEKLNEAICYLMDSDGSKKYKILFTETHFALAEFYVMKEDYLGALQCLKALERDLTPCGEELETQISRLYAKMAKVMELCLEFSQDFTIYENEFEVAYKTQASTDRNPDEVVLSYFQKALDFSKNEPLVLKRELEEIQRSCYLGKAAVLLKCYKGQNETVRNLTEVRQNLTSTEKLFDRISHAMKCQFYLIEAFLLFYEGRYKMAADKVQMARNIADEENFLEKECLGSKRLRFLLEELEQGTH